MWRGAELYRREAVNRETLTGYGHCTPDDWLERRVYSRFPSLGVSLLLVLETTRQLRTARARELEAAAQVRRAVVELERSVGRRLFDVSGMQSSDAETTAIRSAENSRISP